MKSLVALVVGTMFQAVFAMGQEINMEELHGSFEMISGDGKANSMYSGSARVRHLEYYWNLSLIKGGKLESLYRVPLVVGFIDGKYVLHKGEALNLLEMVGTVWRAFRISENQIVLMTREIDVKDHENWYVVAVELSNKEWRVRSKFKIDRLSGKLHEDLEKVAFDFKESKQLGITLVTRGKETTRLLVSIPNLAVRMEP